MGRTDLCRVKDRVRSQSAARCADLSSITVVTGAGRCSACSSTAAASGVTVGIAAARQRGSALQPSGGDLLVPTPEDWDVRMCQGTGKGC
jgi:hypothetical protein